MGEGFKIAYNGEFWVITQIIHKISQINKINKSSAKSSQKVRGKMTRAKSKKGENLAKSRK